MIESIEKDFVHLFEVMKSEEPSFSRFFSLFYLRMNDDENDEIDFFFSFLFFSSGE